MNRITLHRMNIGKLLSFYSLYYAQACSELAGPISASLLSGNNVATMSKKCRGGGELLAIPCPILPAQDLNLRPPAPETNAVTLNYYFPA